MQVTEEMEEMEEMEVIEMVLGVSVCIPASGCDSVGGLHSDKLTQRERERERGNWETGCDSHSDMVSAHPHQSPPWCEVRETRGAAGLQSLSPCC